MLHIDDRMIEDAVTAQAAQEVLHAAFLDFGRGSAAMQRRVRTEAGGVKLSTLGAVIPGQGVAGAKVYTTIKGQFQFVILLFSAADGRPLATCDAGALTRKRTAACTVLAAGALASPRSSMLGLFGAGTQGVEHAAQLSARFALEAILVNDPYAPPEVLERIGQRCGVPARMAAPAEIAAQADIVVTASRSTTPLFAGRALRAGAFVGAIGSSLPHTRELDDEALRRARAVVVEWREQTLSEAGDLVLAAPDTGLDAKVVELADVLAGRTAVRQADEDIVIYKSVGVGLEDVALAGYAYRRLAAERGWPAP
ncbi:ornithine cyclodeaminase family protein [Bordetella bronchiseptica]